MSQQQGYKRPRTQSVVVYAKKKQRTGPKMHAKAAFYKSPNLNGEVKVIQARTTGVLGQTFTSVGTVLDVLGGATQGTGMRNNFIGRKLQPIGIDMRYTILQPQGNYTTNSLYSRKARVTLLQWGDAYAVGTGPSITGIYEDQTTIESPFELVNWETIDVLHDSIVTLDPQMSISATSQTGQSHTCHKYIKGKKLTPILYNDVSNYWQKGGILLSYYSADATAPQLQMSLYIRVYFVDI